MTLFFSVVVVLFLLAFLVGLRFFSNSESWDRDCRWARALFPAASLFFILIVAGNIGLEPQQNWNAARIAPSVALAKGFTFYASQSDGPILGTHYGPVKALLYMPATLGRTPTEVIVIAGVLNFLVMALPLLYLSLSAVRWRIGQERIIALYGFLFAAGSLYFLDSTHYMVAWVHVDAPAVGLALVSCVILIRTGGSTPSTRQMIGAALAASLSVWSKQSEIFLVPGQLLYLWLAHGRGPAIRYLGIVAGLGGLVSLVFLGLFGFQETWFNLVVIPAGQPVTSDLALIAGSSIDLILGGSLFLLIVAAGVMISRASLNSPLDLEDRRLWWRTEDWSLLLLVALCLLPISVMAPLKTGGAVNSQHSHYFLIAAASAVLIRFATTALASAGSRAARRLLFLVALVSTLLLSQGVSAVFDLPKIYDNKQEALFRLLHGDLHQVTASVTSANVYQDRAKPLLTQLQTQTENLYAPWSPLPALMAKDQLNHFEYSLYDRALAGVAVNQEHFLRYVPQHIRFVLYDTTYLEFFTVRRYLPEFSQQVVLPELPGWIVCLRPDDPILRETPSR
jgi:hypothetical protein